MRSPPGRVREAPREHPWKWPVWLVHDGRSSARGASLFGEARSGRPRGQNAADPVGVPAPAQSCGAVPLSGAAVGHLLDGDLEFLRIADLLNGLAGTTRSWLGAVPADSCSHLRSTP